MAGQCKLWGAWELQGYSAVGHRLDTAGICRGWALQGYGWTLQGYAAVGHCMDTLRWGTAGILGGWALQAGSAVGHCRDTLQLGSAGILGGCSLCGWALCGGRGEHRFLKSPTTLLRWWGGHGLFLDLDAPPASHSIGVYLISTRLCEVQSTKAT